MNQIEYQGKPLASQARVVWKVRVWNEAGQPSAWSEPATWSMGLLKAADWKAKWIGYDEPTASKAMLPPPYLRKEFTLKHAVKKATLYATALGIYEVSINGRRVGRDVLAPGWSDFRHRVRYFTYDVTDLVKRGENAVGAILGDGWYGSYLAFTGKRRFYGERPAAHAPIEHRAGQRHKAGHRHRRDMEGRPRPDPLRRPSDGRKPRCPQRDRPLERTGL